MRHIDINKIKLPTGWKVKAEKALNDIKLLSPKDKKKAINNKDDIWKDLKVTLQELSHNKCWYCETKQIRSFNPVDHFRPKNKVKEDIKHEGYWWLAFSCQNYRFSCTLCNSKMIDTQTGELKGKGDRFPLFNPKKRCKCETDDISQEDPILLDPTKSTDPGLLSFIDTGEAVPKFDEIHNKKAFQRAKTSIDFYHLNHTDTLDRRQVISNEINNAVEKGNYYYNKLNSAMGATGFHEIVEKILSYVKEDSEYSAFSRTILMGHRDKEWISNFVLRCS